MEEVFVKYTWRDWLIAIAISLFVFLIAGTQLTKGMPEIGAGDYAAYISVGKSLADGTFEEQTLKNYYMHPSALPEEAKDGSLVYVWGYPLMLSVVYRLVGWDYINYSSVIFYKMPSLIAFAITAGVLYLLYRRFLPSFLSYLLYHLQQPEI